MERRVTSHTEEEEMNQRRRLLTLARKGDQKAIDLLFELYQVRVFSGDALKQKKLPSLPIPKPNSSTVIILFLAGPSNTCNSIMFFLEV